MLAGRDGRFGGRGVTIKAAVTAGWLVAQELTNRKGDYDKPFAVGNFAMGGVLVGVAVRNGGTK